MNNFMNKLSRLYIKTKTIYVMSTSVESCLIIFPKTNKVDPDKAVLPGMCLYGIKGYMIDCNRRHDQQITSTVNVFHLYF